jgi:hypothetical protein
MTKCQTCFYGAITEGFWHSVYKFSSCYKIGAEGKEIHILYSAGDLGCRLTEWNEKEKTCLANSFSEYKKFEIKE